MRMNNVEVHMKQTIKFLYKTQTIEDRVYIDWRDTINSLRILLAANPHYIELEKFLDVMEENLDKKEGVTRDR